MVADTFNSLNGETRYVAWVGGQPVCNAKTTIGKGDTAWCTRDTLIQYQGQYIKVRFYNCEALNPHSQVSDEEKTCPKKEQDSDPTNGESDKCMRQKGGDKIQGVYLKLLDANGGEDSKYPDVLCGDLRETFQCGPALVVTRLQVRFASAPSITTRVLTATVLSSLTRWGEGQRWSVSEGFRKAGRCGWEVGRSLMLFVSARILYIDVQPIYLFQYKFLSSSSSPFLNFGVCGSCLIPLARLLRLGCLPRSLQVPLLSRGHLSLVITVAFPSFDNLDCRQLRQVIPLHARQIARTVTCLFSPAALVLCRVALPWSSTSTQRHITTTRPPYTLESQFRRDTVSIVWFTTSSQTPSTTSTTYIPNSPSHHHGALPTAPTARP